MVTIITRVLTMNPTVTAGTEGDCTDTRGTTILALAIMTAIPILTAISTAMVPLVLCLRLGIRHICMIAIPVVSCDVPW